MMAIRSYGPGKFSTIIDSYAYEVSLDGADEELGYPEGGGWYGLIYLDRETHKRIHEIAEEHDDELTREETELLDDSAAVIFFERSDGIVEAEWFDTQHEAEKAWDEIEEEFEEEGEDD